MSKSHYQNSQSGFTLIELLVVISIISLIASIIAASLNSARIKSRNAVRRASLVQVQKALELFYNNNNFYPNTGGAYYSDNAAAGPEITYVIDYIPGLVPQYLAKLPKDPSNGTACPGSGYNSAYLYRSTADGQNYKLMDHCGFEGAYDPQDPLLDPLRDGGTQNCLVDGFLAWSLAVYTPGGCNL